MTRSSLSPDALLLAGPAVRLGIDLTIAGRIESLDQWIPVPLAPSGVLGLAEARGRPITLLAPTLWSDDPAIDADAAAASHAFTFAAPFEHLGLVVDTKTTLGPLPEGARDDVPLLTAQRLRESLAALSAESGASR